MIGRAWNFGRGLLLHGLNLLARRRNDRIEASWEGDNLTISRDGRTVWVGTARGVADEDYFLSIEEQHRQSGSDE